MTPETIGNPAVLLRLENVHAYYQNGETVTIGVQKVNLSFERGEFILITGESGSGKSTLLNVISALHPYQDGDMFLNGESTLWYDENDWEEYRRRHIGFVFQDYRLIEGYTALQNVMISMLLMGEDEQSAQKQAKEWLARVGLSGLENRRAAKMSSGQKQRLSIARALAKNTDIIVADEPTGNLDEDNGRQIVQLLSELAANRLVIMVSHNVAEAKPFMTRHVRLHDGMVASDERLSPPHLVPPNEEKKNGEADRRLLSRRIAAFSRRAQPRKALLITGFMAAVTLSCFLLLTTFLANMDDTTTRFYDNTVFRNGDRTRIVVRRTDGASITDSDMEYFRSFERVTRVDRWDYVNDCAYFWQPEVDYYIKESFVNIYSGAEIVDTIMQSSVLFLTDGSFLSTVSCIMPEDLAAGKLPDTPNGIAIYGDASLLGTQIPFYFRDSVAWGKGDFVGMDMTVTGILSEPTDQVYFSEQLAQAFLVNAFGYEEAFVFWRASVSRNNSNRLFFIPIIFPDATVPENACVLSNQWISDLDDIGSPVYLTRMIDQQWTDVRELSVSGLSPSGQMTVKVNPVSFLTDDMASVQASMYIEDYAYTNEVLQALHSSGAYEACSAYRAGSLRYDENKVKVNLTTLAACAGLFVLAPFLEALILLAVLRFSLRDMIVMRAIGLSKSMIRRVNARELSSYAACSLPVAAVAAALLTFSGWNGWSSLLVYFHWYDAFLLIAWQAVAALLLTVWYQRYLSRRLGKREATL